MLRFLFCLVFITPIFFLPSLFGNQDAVARIEIEEDTYDAFTDTKITTLENCEADTIPVYFREEYVESHSAEFLHNAVDAASKCFGATVRVVNLKFENMTDEELKLADDQVEEVTEFLRAYKTDLDVKRTFRDAELDTRAVNGRAVTVEFEFNRSLEKVSAAQ